MNDFTLKHPCIIIVLIATVALTACEKFSGDQTIPSYLYIEKFTLTTNEVQGTAKEKITDVWVKVDGEDIGAFELPATFPVLQEGMHTVTLRAGIKLNGIASTRVPYPFFQPVTYEVKLVKDSVVSIHPVITYYPDVKFAWKEDFEAGGSSLVKTTDSDTAIVLTSEINQVCEGSFSGAVHLDDNTLLFEAATMVEYTLPRSGASVFLEMNFKTNNVITVGIMGIATNQVIQTPCVVLNHCDTWNKIYINLTPAITDMTTAQKFKVFVGVLKEDEVDHPLVLLDNFKLVHFD